MKRGFPRPQMHLEVTTTNNTKDAEGNINPRGSYGESWDNKTYPVPYTAEEYSISTLHSDRLKECVLEDLCIACGEAVDEIVVVMLQHGKIFSESGPLHEKCSRLTQAMCPHIKVTGWYTFQTVPWISVKSQVAALV